MQGLHALAFLPPDGLIIGRLFLFRKSPDRGFSFREKHIRDGFYALFVFSQKNQKDVFLLLFASAKSNQKQTEGGGPLDSRGRFKALHRRTFYRN